GEDASPCSTSASDRWYVPSGATVRGATEQLVLYNPFPDATSVDISFATDEGGGTGVNPALVRAPRALQGLSVPPRSLRLVPLDQLPARRSQIATTVRARTGRILVDRVQLFDGTGDPLGGGEDDAEAGPTPEGLASTAAIPTTAARWLFPDAVRTAGTRTLVAVHNPSSRPAEVDVAITYQEADRFPDIEPVQLTVRAGQQELVDLSAIAEIAEATPYTIDVRSLEGVPVVAEQLVHGAVPAAPPTTAEDGATEEPPPDDEGGEAEEAPPEDDEAAEATDVEPSTGFAVVPGSPVAAEAWLLPSFTAGTRRTAQVVVANPGPDPVTVRVVGFANGRRSVLEAATVRVPAGDRRTLALADLEDNPGLLVRASGAVVVGRSVVSEQGRGVVWALATPLPETVRALPPLG
ncbi:MAG TPA: DUF5719 family protein, partial [Aquihabitans sp.]|nr:DUF5719 family protein [Aquihabitans sp.]